MLIVLVCRALYMVFLVGVRKTGLRGPITLFAPSYPLHSSQFEPSRQFVHSPQPAPVFSPVPYALNLQQHKIPQLDVTNVHVWKRKITDALGTISC